MSIHPMFRVVLASESPDHPEIYQIEIAYTAKAKRFHDWSFSSVAEAEAAIPQLQATGRLPKDDELYLDLEAYSPPDEM